ncbi:hypothetical protein DFS34DRAFT_612415 [Phlyctochytrium arcticum]|nr:hypothetical protein DFS34DRAFT_612415 [Phlyctochytrium arcticum]
MSHALIYGGAGALGRAIVGRFRNAQWTVTSIDFTANADASHNVVLDKSVTGLDAVGRDVEKRVGLIVGDVGKLGVVVNAAGGWAGGNLKDESLYQNVSLMFAQSVHSTTIAARLAALHLEEEGLLASVGASAATEGTPGMVAYGAAKAAVHHIIQSAAGKGSGLPLGAKAIAILPITIDTPMNRKFMPDADTSTWTAPGVIGDKLINWASKREQVQNGGMYRVTTRDGKSSFDLVT